MSDMAPGEGAEGGIAWCVERRTRVVRITVKMKISEQEDLFKAKSLPRMYISRKSTQAGSIIRCRQPSQPVPRLSPATQETDASA